MSDIPVVYEQVSEETAVQIVGTRSELLSIKTRRSKLISNAFLEILEGEYFLAGTRSQVDYIKIALKRGKTQLMHYHKSRHPTLHPVGRPAIYTGYAIQLPIHINAGMKYWNDLRA